MLVCVWGTVAMAQTTRTWVGAGNGGAGTDFNTAANWSPSGVPASSDICQFTAGTPGNPTNITFSADITVAQINVTQAISGNNSFWQLSIASGRTVTVTDMTINDGDAAGNRQPLVVVNGTLNVSGTLTLGGSGDGGRLAASTGTINASGAVNFGTSSTNAFTGTLNLNATGNQTLTITPAIALTNLTLSGSGVKSKAGVGTLTVNGTLTVDGTATYSGTTPTYGAAATITYAGTSAQTTGTELPATINNLTVNNASSVTLTAAVTVTTLTIGNVTANSVFSDGGFQVTSTGTLNLTSGTFKLGSASAATTFPAFATRNISSGTTVEYASGVAQTVSITPSYQNLTFSGAGTKTTASGTLSVAGNWAAGSTTALNTNNTVISLTGNLSGSGNITQGTELITVGGDWTNTGTFTASSAGVTLTGSSKQITGASGGITFTTLTVSGTYTNNNAATLAVSTALSGGGTLTNPASGTLAISGTSEITTLTATASGNTVNYNGAGAQTIKATTYHHLTLSNASAKTAGGALTVNGNLTLSETATFAGGTSLTHTFLGSWIVNTTAATPFSFTTSSTINFNTPSPAAATSISGTSTATLGFNTVNLNNTSGFSSNLNFSISGTLTVAANVTFTPAAAVIVSGAGTLTGSGTVKVTRTAATPDFNSQYTITGKTLTNLTVDYAGADAQTVNALNYGNITISTNGTRTVTLASSGTIGIAGVFSPTATTTTYTITGSTIDFNGLGAQTIPLFNYNNLTSSSTGERTLASSGTIGISGTFTPGTNSYTITGSTVDFNGSGTQIIPPFSYALLRFSNTGEKQIVSATEVIANGETELSSGTPLRINGSLTINGNLTVAGSVINNGIVNVDAPPVGQKSLNPSQ